MIDEYRAGIEQAVEVISDWLKGNEQPLSWNPPQYAPMWTWCLAANLQAAGMLCKAFDLGYDACPCAGYYEADGSPKRRDWSPGCQRTAP